MSDGAAAILLARRSKAEELGLPILGVLRSYAVVGVPPDIMGVGPAYAIPVALQKAGKMAPSHPRFGSSPCLSCCCQRRVPGVGLRVPQSEGGAPRPLPDPTAGTRSPIWNRGRHTGQPSLQAMDGVGPQGV